jgi:hypothetical protein
MQHYGTPTRLLDWTKSVLVALWFVVEDEEQHKTNGELWTMHPESLNDQACGQFGIPFVRENNHLTYCARQPYWNGSLEKLAEAVGIEEPVKSYMAFEPRQTFRRMIAQSSTFTIHPDPNESQSILDVLTDEKLLCRWIIPAGRKAGLKKDLMALGFTHDTLFPDLEGVSRQIVETGNVLGYSPPEPPVCDGPYEEDT